MKIMRFAAVAASLWLAAPEVVRADKVDDQVTAAYATWDAAFNAGDAKAVAAFYGDRRPVPATDP